MNLNLEAKYVYDVVEATIKDFRSNPEKYTVAGDKKLAIRKHYTRNKPLNNEQCGVTLGITRNKSEIYLEFFGEYSATRNMSVKRPWFKGRKYHNQLLKQIRAIAFEINNRHVNHMKQQQMQELVTAVRDAIPGAFDNAIDDVLINGDSK